MGVMQQPAGDDHEADVGGKSGATSLSGGHPGPGARADSPDEEDLHKKLSSRFVFRCCNLEDACRLTFLPSA
jgi:hypothetical protein